MDVENGPIRMTIFLHKQVVFHFHVYLQQFEAHRPLPPTPLPWALVSIANESNPSAITSTEQAGEAPSGRPQRNL